MNDDVNQRPERVWPASTGSAMFDRYAGHVPWKMECMTQHSLNWMRQPTGSQCNCNRHGVTCSRVLSSKIRRAAEFCTRCKGAIVVDARNGHLKTGLLQCSTGRCATGGRTRCNRLENWMSALLCKWMFECGQSDMTQTNQPRVTRTRCSTTLWLVVLMCRTYDTCWSVDFCNNHQSHLRH